MRMESGSLLAVWMFVSLSMSEKIFDQIKYQNTYNSQKYDRVTVMLPKGMKEELRARAQALGLSLNQYVIKAIDALALDGGSSVDR